MITEDTPENTHEPIETRNLDGPSQTVLLCEHASRYIPSEYNGLGLPETETHRHIAWDIGAGNVARALSDRLKAPAFLGTISRLVIDLNRPESAHDLIPVQSELTPIPGNHDLSAADRQARLERYFHPYHEAVSRFLDRHLAAGIKTRLITIHSFTPVYKGDVRPWHAGVLYDHAETLAGQMIEALKEPGLVIGANAPYVTNRENDYAIPIHGDDRDIPAVMIEIRQDLISDPAGVAVWVDRLARALQD